MQTPALILPPLPRPTVRPSFARLLSALCLVFVPLQAASFTSLTGTYESEGSVVETNSDYTGPVSLAALFGLEFDLAAGSLQYAKIARVEIEQRDRSFTVRTKREGGATQWTGVWERNGGYEPTRDGVKILLRHARFRDDFFMFTLSAIKEGEVLLVEVQRVQATRFGPIGKPVGKFLFLRIQPAS